MSDLEFRLSQEWRKRVAEEYLAMQRLSIGFLGRSCCYEFMSARERRLFAAYQLADRLADSLREVNEL